MIEVVSYPADLTHWDLTKTPFYLELFGDTSPVLDTHYGEVIKPGPVDGSADLRILVDHRSPRSRAGNRTFMGRGVG